MWICCKCLFITEDYPSNDYCWSCGNENDFEELTDDEMEEIENEKQRKNRTSL